MALRTHKVPAVASASVFSTTNPAPMRISAAGDAAHQRGLLADRLSLGVKACLAHALGNPFGVRGILEWQSIDMIFQ